MANGKLVQILMKTGVKDYLEFKGVDGSYVYQYQKAGWLTSEKHIHKVPASDTEALSSSLIPVTDKLKGRSFFLFVAGWRKDDPSTWQGFDPLKTKMGEVYQKFGLTPNIVDFVGHAISLYPTDDYLERPMGETMERLRLYMNSLVRYGVSPFIYPVYGLGSLPEGFSRLSAVHGGTYMLNTGVKSFKFDENGMVCGVENFNGEVAKCSRVICDPSYVIELLPHKVRHVGNVIRSICVLNAPIPATEKRKSCQIILPQKQLNRKHDIYVAMISSAHGVCPVGKYIALVSATIETDQPEKEIEPALDLLGPIEKQFFYTQPLYEPTDDGTKDGIFVTASYDASSHFESATEDVLRVWKNMHGGQDLDLSTVKAPTRTEIDHSTESTNA